MNISLIAAIKLASIAVHADELIDGHCRNDFDINAIRGLLLDPDVQQALSDMDQNTLLPLRRDGKKYIKDGK